MFNIIIKPRQSGKTEELINRYIDSALHNNISYIIVMHEDIRRYIYCRIRDKIKFKDLFEREIIKNYKLTEIDKIFNNLKDHIVTISSIHFNVLRGCNYTNIFIDEQIPSPSELLELLHVAKNVYLYTSIYLTKKEISKKYDIPEYLIHRSGIKPTSKLTKVNKNV